MPLRPKLVPTLVTAALLPLLLSLGVWQLHRAEQKRELAKLFLERSSGPALDLGAANEEDLDAEALAWRRIHARGTFLATRQVLLDNQVREGVVGYQVLSPLRLEGRSICLLVDRGWVPAGTDRNQAPAVDAPDAPIAVDGLAGPPPPVGIRLSGEQPEHLGTRLLRVARVDFDVLRVQLDCQLLPFVLYLSDGAPGGFVREWRPPGFGPERHVAYAVQWFAFAGILVILYAVFGLRSTSDGAGTR